MGPPGGVSGEGWPSPDWSMQSNRPHQRLRWAPGRLVVNIKFLDRTTMGMLSCHPLARPWLLPTTASSNGCSVDGARRCSIPQWNSGRAKIHSWLVPNRKPPRGSSARVPKSPRFTKASDAYPVISSSGPSTLEPNGIPGERRLTRGSSTGQPR